MSISKKIFNSFLEMKSIYAIVAIAMLLALRVVLGFFANATLPFFGNSVKLSAAFCLSPSLQLCLVLSPPHL